MSIRSLLLCCILLFPCIASASPLSIQPSVSTLGVGVDISYRQNSFIAYRLSAFTQPFDTKIKLKGIQYNIAHHVLDRAAYLMVAAAQQVKMLSGYPLALIISSWIPRFPRR